jgi:hypothetical protein
MNEREGDKCGGICNVKSCMQNAKLSCKYNFWGTSFQSRLSLDNSHDYQLKCKNVGFKNGNKDLKKYKFIIASNN